MNKNKQDSDSVSVADAECEGCKDDSKYCNLNKVSNVLFGSTIVTLSYVGFNFAPDVTSAGILFMCFGVVEISRRWLRGDYDSDK